MEPIGLGDAGDEVADVQRRLEGLGALPPDAYEPGVFDEATREAVRIFQQRRGLTADGVVGQDTFLTLHEAGWELGDRLLHDTRPMLRGDDVRELQRRLNRLGFDAGYVDGIYGPDTAAATREFQLNTGLPDDGITGPGTVAALRSLHRQHQEAPAFAVRERASMRDDAGRPSLAEVRLLLDPGHGPDDPGATGPDGTPEHEITWGITNRLAGRLTALGAHVVLSRGPLTTPGTSERAALANREEVAAILSVHLNRLASVEAHGAAAYYFGQDQYVSQRGRALARLAVDNIVARTGTANCRTHASTSTLLREARAPAVVVEPGFLTHPNEGPRLLQPGYQHTLAAALTDALVTFLLGGLPRDGEATPASAAMSR